MLRKLFSLFTNVLIAIITSSTLGYCICCDMFLDKNVTAYRVLAIIARIVGAMIIVQYGFQFKRIIKRDFGKEEY